MRDELLQHGFDLHPIPDGQIHRFKGHGDSKPNCWYVFHGDYGAFGSWKDGFKQTWCDKRSLTGTEHRALKLQISQNQKVLRAQRRMAHMVAAAEAQELWDEAQPAVEHPYLQAKRVQPHGIRQVDEVLIIPMYRDRQIRSIQQIFKDGRKMFLKGGEVSACYFPMGRVTDRLYICEGFATSATVHEVTGHAVACAFSGHNMAKVAKAFRRRFPELDIVIAGDAGEAGEKYADEAMVACMGRYVLPEFKDSVEASDWNDYCQLFGADATRKELV